jgi:hypothetical protein
MTLRLQLSEVLIIWERPAVSECAPGSWSCRPTFPLSKPAFYLLTINLQNGISKKLTLQLCRDRKLLCRAVPSHRQHVRLTANLAVLHILLLRPRGLIHRRLHPLPTSRALKSSCMHLHLFLISLPCDSHASIRGMKRRSQPISVSQCTNRVEADRVFIHKS